VRKRAWKFLASTVIVLLLNMIDPRQGYAQVPPPLPPNNCVGIASDSNGYGHVTFQIPPIPGGDVGIVFVRPLKNFLEDSLREVGLDSRLRVSDRSLSASSLTASERSNYIASSFFSSLIGDRCRFVMVGPFIPDVAANIALPVDYTYRLPMLINDLIRNNPRVTIFLLSFYQTDRAEFTATNNGFGLRPERIDSFNAKLAEVCRPKGTVGRYPQVICLNTQGFFEDMGKSYILGPTTREAFDTLYYAPTDFKPRIDYYFKENPGGLLIGDGIHLSYAGRARLTQEIAKRISRMMDF